MLKTVHRYMVYEGTTTDELEHRVNFFLNSGWVLAGGLIVSNGKFYQAMTYTAEEEVRTINE